MLQPTSGDVDLGAPLGPPLGMASASTFVLPVRVMSSSALKSFQVRVRFDAAKVRIPTDGSCARGGGWSGERGCAANSVGAEDEFLMFGADDLS